MHIKKANELSEAEVTSESVYLNRRQFISNSLLASGSVLASSGLITHSAFAKKENDLNTKDLIFTEAKNHEAGFATKESLTPSKVATKYNNFYEFGQDKSDPAKHAHRLTTDPWSVTIDGEAEVTGTFNLEDILKGKDLEERIYRLRCVETWSMVIPWVGFPLADLIKKFKPTSKARYVEFKTLYRPKEMRGQRSQFSSIDWPYREGLRMDEAMHPLTILAVGMYGKVMPNQNGAPLRLVVPWKYGFKSIKSIVSISFKEKQPRTSWNMQSPREYGFYSNVNPNVSHPRWKQDEEVRLPSTLFNPNRRKTELFNGYADQVASLYAGMDLKIYY